ncbi:GIY-YIG nuclease family protein [candidate division WWE3 bacterium]|nr:GIY-YIG nuclease family protein [candidate division WWE3 bacterium]
MNYFVYILKCNDGTYYCGYTTNLEKRIKSHNTSKIGARYTLGRRPVSLEYFETYQTLSDALKREHVIKRLTRIEKESLITKSGSSV